MKLPPVQANRCQYREGNQTCGKIIRDWNKSKLCFYHIRIVRNAEKKELEQ